MNWKPRYVVFDVIGVFQTIFTTVKRYFSSHEHERCHRIAFGVKSPTRNVSVNENSIVLDCRRFHK